MQTGLINPNVAWDFFSGFMTPLCETREPGLEVSSGTTSLLSNTTGPSSNAPSATTTATADPGPYIRQLADLNVKLYEHFKLLPPACNQPTILPSLSDARLFPIDSTFVLTQSLIEITSHLYPTPSPCPISSTTSSSSSSSSSSSVPQSTSSSSSCSSSGSSSNSRSSTTTATASTPANPPVDQATTLLLLSCADRVFDIYSLIFTHMRTCIAHHSTAAPLDGRKLALALPQLRIGGFAPPAEVAVAGYMFMVILMAGGLFERLREALGFWRDGGGSGSAGGIEKAGEGGNPADYAASARRRSGFPDFTEAAREEVGKRARAVAGEIASTRRLFLDMPEMKKGSGDVLAMFMPGGGVRR
ncbi:hypothetical protein MFIFM68171_10141 [Madurella fahalii]|uniref:Uncharacterized protein n=1 Tax=Madurella fahalii TaxID=1157608 RepID=A0ABQ0GQD3_9PEZI